MYSHNLLNEEYLRESIQGLEDGEKTAFLRREFESFKSAFGMQVGEEFLAPFARLLYPTPSTTPAVTGAMSSPCTSANEGGQQSPIKVGENLSVLTGTTSPAGIPATFPVAAGDKSGHFILDKWEGNTNFEFECQVEPKLDGDGDSDMCSQSQDSTLVGHILPPCLPIPKAKSCSSKTTTNFEIAFGLEPKLDVVVDVDSEVIAPITSIISPPSFPPNFSNISPLFSLSNFPPLAKTKVVSNSFSSNSPIHSSIPIGQPGQPLTGQPLTSQPLTSQISSNFTNYPNPKPPTNPEPFPGPKPGLPIPGPRPGHPSPSPHPSILGPPKNPWSSLLQATSPRMCLTYVNPSVDAIGSLKLSEGTSKEGELFWNNTLIGYSLDKKIPFKVLQHRAITLWGRFGLSNVRVNKEGFYFFSFLKEEGLHLVLSKGPWVIFGQQIILKRWSRDFEFRKEEFISIPTWIKLFGIPTTYWSSSGLSAIASKIGVPLYADEITSSASILEFARVCVDMKVGGEFPTSFKVHTEHNEEFVVRVEYGWKPRPSCPSKPSETPTTSTPISPNPLPTPSPPKHPASAILHTTSPSTPLVSEENVDHIVIEDGMNEEIIPSKESVDAIPSPRVPPSKTKTSSPNTHNPFKALEDFVDAELVMVDNTGIPEGSSYQDSSDDEIHSSPMGWGHKIKLVDELDRKENKILRRSGKKKLGQASGAKRGKRK